MASEFEHNFVCYSLHAALRHQHSGSMHPGDLFAKYGWSSRECHLLTWEVGYIDTHLVNEGTRSNLVELMEGDPVGLIDFAEMTMRWRA